MAMELFDGSYPKQECAPEDIVVPMCQSPKIADVLLRARSLPANDNYLLVETGMNSHKSKSTCKATWPALVLLCVGMLLFF
jgi:hypothetical protein